MLKMFVSIGYLSDMRTHRMTKLILITLILIAWFESCNNSKQKQAPKLKVDKPADKWIFSGIAESVLKFKNGKQFNTHLYDPDYLGQVGNGTKAPFLIFSGRDCNECDANISIYIHSPSDGDINVANGENSYEYPGIEKGYDNDSLLYKARAFFGHVLPGIKGVIWYQQQLMEDRSFPKSVFLVKLNNGLKKDTVFKNTTDLKLTLQLLKEGQCEEIKGIEYSSEP